MSTAVIAQRETSPLCQTPEHVFNRVALFIQSHSVSCWMTAFGTCRDTRPDCACCERITQPGGIVSFISSQLFGHRQIGSTQPRTVILTALPFGQGDAERTASAIANSIALGMQSTCCPSDPALPPCCLTRAPGRCAVTWLAAIIRRDGLGPRFGKTSKLLDDRVWHVPGYTP